MYNYKIYRGNQVVAFLARRVSVAFHLDQVASDHPFLDLEAFRLALQDAVAFARPASFHPVREACWVASDCPLVAFLVDAASGLAREASGWVLKALVACLADLALVFALLLVACLVLAVRASASVLPLVDRLELAVLPLAAEDRRGSCFASGSQEGAWTPFSVAGEDPVVAGEVSCHLVVDLPSRLLAGRLVAQLAVEVVAAFAYKNQMY